MSNLVAWQFALTLISSLYFLSASQNCYDLNGRIGTCTRAATCQQQSNNLYYGPQTLYALGMNYALQSFCGFHGTQILICCIIMQANAASVPQSLFGSYTYPLSGTSTASANNFLQSAFQFGSLNNNLGNSQAPTAAPSVNVPTNQSFILPHIPQTNQLRIPTVYRPVPPAGQSSIPVNSQNVKSSECGISKITKNRVVGGNSAKKGSYPWIVALGYTDMSNGNAINFLCAGSLIKSTHLLTSAHCVNGNLTLARLGAHVLDQQIYNDAVDIAIKRYIIHEQYDQSSISNDIALVELISPAPNTDFIGIICLPKANQFVSNNLIGMNPFIAGWGATSFQGPTSKILREAQVPVVNTNTCEQNYASIFQLVKFNERVICAGTSSVDACQGDSGGPLMLPQLDNTGNYHYFLIGIISYGYECARPGFPGVYTNVASYIPWIQSRL